MNRSKSWETETDLGWGLDSERRGISRNQDGCATLGGLEEAHGLRLQAVLPVAGFAAGVGEG